MEIMVNREQLETLLNGILENEFLHVSEKEEFNDKYQKLILENTNTLKEMKEIISEKAWEKFLKYEETQGEIECSYRYRFWFNEGVKAGITNLNFLGKSEKIKFMLTNLK